MSTRFWRRRVSAVLLAALHVIGCDATSPYRTALREQTNAIETLAKTLDTVHDKSSMQAARAQLSARFDEFEGIRQRAQKLQPPGQDMMRELQDDGEKLRQALEKIQDQVRRINAIPGGAEFLAGLGNKSGLLGDRAP
jgi:hypothetical protein